MAAGENFKSSANLEARLEKSNMVDGKLVDCSSSSGKDMLGNAGIMAGLTFFTTLGADLGTGGDPVNPLSWIRAIISAGAAFFGSLALQKGLKKE